MTKQAETKVEYSAEEKALFVQNNLKVMFWGDREIVTQFDKLCKDKGTTRKDGIMKLMQKFVEKNTK